jgi:hypothetical protein
VTKEPQHILKISKLVGVPASPQPTKVVLIKRWVADEQMCRVLHFFTLNLQSSENHCCTILLIIEIFQSSLSSKKMCWQIKLGGFSVLAQPVIEAYMLKT